MVKPAFCLKNVKSLIKDDSKFYLFPCEFFSPKDVQSNKIHSTKNTYTIHHFGSNFQVDAGLRDGFDLRAPIQHPENAECLGD